MNFCLITILFVFFSSEQNKLKTSQFNTFTIISTCILQTGQIDKGPFLPQSASHVQAGEVYSIHVSFSRSINKQRNRLVIYWRKKRHFFRKNVLLQTKKEICNKYLLLLLQK